ncbi:MAG: DUF4097 family beta strand repeat protein [Clostridia bacterium]|nr:DUF4097 family beta strand repeat protein [Clostridia bacterium]
MKPASIIFLIVSVVIIIAGLALCSAGTAKAKEANISLFSTDVSMKDGDVITTNAVTGELNKIRINLSDANVKICPSETGESYLELVNFTIGTYDFSIQNRMLILDNETSIFSLLHLTEGNFNFNGLRHYLTYRITKNSGKTAILYLTDDDRIKNVEVNVKKGKVLIEGFSHSADYIFDVSNGSVMLSKLSTQSRIRVKVGKGDCILNDVSAGSYDLSVDQGTVDVYLKALNYTVLGNNTPKLKITAKSGAIYVGLATLNTSILSLDFSVGEGTISYNGEPVQGSTFSQSGHSGNLPIILQTEKGDISFLLNAPGNAGDYKDFFLQEEPERNPETESEPGTEPDSSAESAE